MRSALPVGWWAPCALCWVLALLLGAGCSSNPPHGTDAAAVDAGVRADARDARRDAADGGSPTDGLPDFPEQSDALPDFPTTDAMLSDATVLYAVGPSADNMGLRTVAADGTGQPAAVSGYAGLIDFDDLKLAGMRGLPLRPDQARLFPGFVASVVLPGGYGTLYSIHRTLTGTSGILKVGLGGKLRLLVEVAGLYADTIAASLAVASDGRVAAAVVQDDKLAVIRCDGTTFSDGKSAALLSAPSGVDKLLAPSLALAGSTVLVVGQTKSGQHQLLAGPADGSSHALSSIALPSSGGQSVAYVGSDITVGERGGYAVVRAGASASKLDLYRVQLSASKAINVTGSPAAIAPRGTVFGEDEAQLAISPKGTWVAYVLNTKPVPTLVARRADGSGSAVVLSGAKFFKSGQLTRVSNLFFSDETHLWFMGGINAAQLDVYGWDASGGKMTNATGFGSTRPPFDAQGGMTAGGAWIDPSAAWLYVAASDVSGSKRKLLAVPLSGGSMRYVLKQGRMSVATSTFAFCPGKPDAYFVARPSAAQPRQALWRFDQSSASAAKQVTGVPGAGTWSISDVSLVDRSCGRLLWSGGSIDSLQRWWSMDSSAALSERLVTAVPRYVSARALLTPDGGTVVLASGGAVDALTLKAVLRSGGYPTTLDPKAGVVEPLAAY